MKHTLYIFAAISLVMGLNVGMISAVVAAEMQYDPTDVPELTPDEVLMLDDVDWVTSPSDPMGQAVMPSIEPLPVPQPVDMGAMDVNGLVDMR